MVAKFTSFALRIVILLLLLFLIGACGRQRPETPSEVAQMDPTAAAGPTATWTPTLVPTPIATPTLTPTEMPTATPNPTPSPTATPTATPTAQPLTVSGDLRAFRITMPEPQPGAPCGVVDLLDFPLDPPDGDRTSGGGSNFGRFSGRYDKYHAGEDWRMASGLSAGAPVHSIGHGQVTYAEPLGWNVDKGVVIVRHTFADGSTILSFYGHLDPPSVTLDVGNCVQRGQTVGKIGHPRTSPHLHFEIGSHMPTVPGPGYWDGDPALVGWQPPSAYIWDYRMSGSPGVDWVRSQSPGFITGLGIGSGTGLVAIEDYELVGMDITDGTVLWRQEEPERMDQALVSADGSLLYLASQPGQLSAYRLPVPEDSGAVGNPVLVPELQWENKLQAVGVPVLLPLPGDGMVMSVWEKMVAVSGEGDILWERELSAAPSDWLLIGDQLLLATLGDDADIWTVDESGMVGWNLQVGGDLVHGSDLLLYDRNDVYRLDAVSRSADLLVPLPRGYPGLLGVLPLPDGRVLLAHSDRTDSRLLMLERDGSMRWQRSYEGVVPGQPSLWLLGNRPYVFFEESTSTSIKVDLFSLDPVGGALTRIFSGGVGHRWPARSSLTELPDGRVLIGIGGTSLVVLDLEEALAAAE